MATVSFAAKREKVTLGNSISTAAFSSDSELINSLNLEQDVELEALRTFDLKNGGQVTRYQQKYKGIPIWGEQVIIGSDSSHLVDYSGGYLLREIGMDLGLSTMSPNLTADEALELLKSQSQHLLAEDAYLYQNEKSELNIAMDAQGKARLVYYTSYFADSQTRQAPTRPHALIDAKPGEIIDQWDGLAFEESRKGTGPGGNIKTGKYYYGKDFPAMMVTSSGSKCTLSYENVKTAHLRNSSSGSTPWAFDCYDNDYLDGGDINGAYGPLNDAHYFGEMVFRMYKEWYDTAPLTFQLLLRVHYGRNYENAFWNGSSMTFGDGLTTFHPLVGLDVVSHEVSHGFTEQNSSLVYRNQSGGMNEAFSDIAGEAAKFFMNGDNDFLVGANIFKAEGRALRYMCNPPQDGKSIGHADDYRNGLDVHYSSGVYNKAFCILAKKDGWGVQKAFDLFVDANQKYWTANVNFNDGSCGTLKAAKDRGYEQRDVIEAFADVGVSCDSIGNKPPKAAFEYEKDTENVYTVKFVDKSTDKDGDVVSWEWDFGDGNTSSEQSPTHTFAGSGKYTVTLKVKDDGELGGTATKNITLRDEADERLDNGETVEGLEAAAKEEIHFFIDVPAGASNLVIKTFDGTGDSDLYVRFGKEPTKDKWDYRPYKGSTDETVTVRSPKEGRYYLMVRGYRTFSGVSLSGSFDE